MGLRMSRLASVTSMRGFWVISVFGKLTLESFKLSRSLVILSNKMIVIYPYSFETFSNRTPELAQKLYLRLQYLWHLAVTNPQRHLFPSLTGMHNFNISVSWRTRQKPTVSVFCRLFDIQETVRLKTNTFQNSSNISFELVSIKKIQIVTYAGDRWALSSEGTWIK